MLIIIPGVYNKLPLQLTPFRHPHTSYNNKAYLQPISSVLYTPPFLPEYQIELETSMHIICYKCWDWKAERAERGGRIRGVGVAVGVHWLVAGG